MTDSRANTPSVVERTRLVKTGAPVVAAHFLRETAAFVLGEGAIVLVPRAGEIRNVSVHDGAILASAADAKRIVTGGDDGKVVATDAEGESTILAAGAKQRWIDHVAVGPAGALAWSAGREACVRTAKGSERTLEVPSTVGGLAFAPKGLRLAVAHYNGLTLWFANAQSEPERLQWKGSHLDVAVSPDGRFVITSMQEPTLHGWRLADRKDMRMSGYGARVRSLDWSVGGKWLATSGSTQLILWPFQGKDGPMGKAPRISRRRRCRSRSSPATRSRKRWRSAMPTGSFCWCASRTAPRFWRAREPARRLPRSPGARPARRSPSAPRTARPASSISGDRRVKRLFLLRRARALRCRARALGAERIVGQPVPCLAAAEQ